MGSQVEEKVTPPAEGEVEEAPQGVDGGEIGSETGDDGWSIKDVPIEVRSHLEKAIKPFHSRTTKAEMRAADFEKKLKELEPLAKTSESVKGQLEALRQEMFRAVSDESYLKSLRSRLGIRIQSEGTDKNLPEGWNEPEAVKARQLLFSEVVKGIEEQYGIRLSDLPRIAQSASAADNLVVQNAHEEIDQTKGSIEKEGLPWSDDILDACITNVGRNAKNGKKITLRQAYDNLFAPAVEAARKKAASTDVKIKGKLPFKPDGKGGQTKLSGDALLRNVIDDLGLPGSFEDG